MTQSFITALIIQNNYCKLLTIVIAETFLRLCVKLLFGNLHYDMYKASYALYNLMCIIRKNNNTKALKFFEGKLSLANLIFLFKYFTVHSGEQ